MMYHRFFCITSSFIITIHTTLVFGLEIPLSKLAPETTLLERQAVRKVLNQVYGIENSDQWEERRSHARDAAAADTTTTTATDTASIYTNTFIDNSKNLLNVPKHNLVYGELGLETLATILDAVGVKRGDRFMDIGSGDGAVVTGASMLYPGYLHASRGIEIVPRLYERSLVFQNHLEHVVLSQQTEEKKEEDTRGMKLCPDTSLYLGNVYQPNDTAIKRLFSDTTLAICFATTWSTGIPGRKLPELSKALGKGGACELHHGARLVIMDGVLDYKKDGFDYCGELKLTCPDTAPYSIARMYTKL